MEIIATNIEPEDYLQEWRRELSRCESVNDLNSLWYCHEETIKNDPEVKQLFLAREDQLNTCLELARQGRTMSMKQINQAVKEAVKNDRL